MNYLFGTPVGRARPTATGHRPVLVLGAYPSALHVYWRSPRPDLSIRAVAVADEPEPFWTGDDEFEQIERWREASGFRSTWGTVGRCGHLNGPSGAWVENQILKPLGVDRAGAWITDCLDTYFESNDAAERLNDPALVAYLDGLGIPTRNHHAHPSEAQIVQLALRDHAERLVNEIREAVPKRLVTLGNAALRVIAKLGQAPPGAPRRLSPDAATYGRPIVLTVAGLEMEWLPLAHPAAPKVYQEAHARWSKGR